MSGRIMHRVSWRAVALVLVFIALAGLLWLRDRDSSFLNAPSGLQEQYSFRTEKQADMTVEPAQKVEDVPREEAEISSQSETAGRVKIGGTQWARNGDESRSGALENSDNSLSIDVPSSARQEKAHDFSTLASDWRNRRRALCPKGNTVRLVMPHVNKAGGRTIAATFKPDRSVYSLIPFQRTRRVNISGIVGHHLYDTLQTMLDDNETLSTMEERDKFNFPEHIPAFDGPNVCTRWMFFVRHPLARTASAFNTMTGRSFWNQADPALENHFFCNSTKMQVLMSFPNFTLESFANLSVEDRSTCELNYHVKFLSGLPLDIEKAKRRLSNMHFVGLTEEFTNSLQLLSWELNLGLERYVPFFNLNKYPPIEELSERTKSVLLEMLKPDLELYDFAVQNLYRPRIEAFKASFNGSFPWGNGDPSECDQMMVCWDKRRTASMQLWKMSDPIPRSLQLRTPGPIKQNVICFPRTGCRLHPILWESDPA